MYVCEAASEEGGRRRSEEGSERRRRKAMGLGVTLQEAKEGGLAKGVVRVCVFVCGWRCGS